MAITVTYARLYNLGNYENERIEVAMDIPEGADASAAYEQLRALVDAQHAAFEAARRAEEEERRRRYMEERQREQDALEAERKARAKAPALGGDLDF